MTAVDYQVGANENDGYWFTAYSVFDTTYVAMGSFGGQQVSSFVRFPGVTIPNGATITAATLQLYYSSLPSGTDPRCEIYAEDAATPGAVTGYANGDAKTKTTAHVAADLPVSGTWWTSGSLVSIIEELMASYSYASGNAIQLLLLGNVSYDGYVIDKDYNDDPTKAAKLHIEYSVPASGSFVPPTRKRRFGALLVR